MTYYTPGYEKQNIGYNKPIWAQNTKLFGRNSDSLGYEQMANDGVLDEKMFHSDPEKEIAWLCIDLLFEFIVERIRIFTRPRKFMINFFSAYTTCKYSNKLLKIKINRVSCKIYIYLYIRQNFSTEIFRYVRLSKWKLLQYS